MFSLSNSYTVEIKKNKDIATSDDFVVSFYQIRLAKTELGFLTV